MLVIFLGTPFVFLLSLSFSPFLYSSPFHWILHTLSILSVVFLLFFFRFGSNEEQRSYEEEEETWNMSMLQHLRSFLDIFWNSFVGLSRQQTCLSWGTCFCRWRIHRTKFRRRTWESQAFCSSSCFLVISWSTICIFFGFIYGNGDSEKKVIKKKKKISVNCS